MMVAYFCEVPSLNEMSGHIPGSLTVDHTPYVMPWHSRLFVSVDSVYKFMMIYYTALICVYITYTFYDLCIYVIYIYM